MKRFFVCKKNIGKLFKGKSRIFLVIIFSILFLFSANYSNTKSDSFDNKNLNTSGIWATLDLIDIFGVNNSRHAHNSLISVYGRLYNRIFDTGKEGYTVALVIDGVLHSDINDVTDSNGYFQIDYNINPSLDVFTSHIIEAEVTDSTPDNVEYRTYLLIYLNTSSFFDVLEPEMASLHGEFFNFQGHLKFQSNDMGISSALVNYYWFDGVNIVNSGSFFTSSDGEIPQDNIIIPVVAENDLNLKLNYSDFPYVSSSEVLIDNTKIFSDISCIWDLPTNIVENNDLDISGTLVSSTDVSVKISNRDIQIYYNNSFIGSDTTDSNGYFSYSYRLPYGTGASNIRIEIIGGIDDIEYINIESETPNIPSSTEEAPFFMFMIIFLPILGTVIAGLAIYGYRYYKKQDKLSRVVNLPLESKIVNLKILKDSGRLEESLSYLFNAIYMDLVNAKFGRARKINETIRDFAIISVKDLNLNPTTIYPFIQKIEEIIYAKPFQITEKDFYNTIELFSPIYLQLTGYNFVLNF